MRGIQSYRDEHKFKKFSNGVRATVKAIRTSWNSEREGEEIGWPKFARLYLPTYRSIARRYQGKGRKGNRSVRGLEQRLERLEKGRAEITFTDMRALAEYLSEGFPTGLLLLFTNAVSDIARRDSKKRIINLLASSQVAIAVLQDYVERNDIQGIVEVINETPDGPRFAAKIAGLRIMVEGFKRERKQAVS